MPHEKSCPNSDNGRGSSGGAHNTRSDSNILQQCLFIKLWSAIKFYRDVRFNILTAVIIKITIFWDALPCIWYRKMFRNNVMPPSSG